MAERGSFEPLFRPVRTRRLTTMKYNDYSIYPYQCVLKCPALSWLKVGTEVGT